jgi:HK97 family phage portal protein
MNIFQKAINSIFGENVTNKLNKAIYQLFNGYFFTLARNKETYVKEGYQKNISVYSAVKLISGKAANAKFYAYTYEGDKIKKLPETHYANKILKKPNEIQRQQQFVEAGVSWLQITGDIYIYKLKYVTGQDKGKINKAYYLPAQYVEIIGGGIAEPITSYRMTIGDQSVVFSKDEVIHLSYFNPNYGIDGQQLYGQSPLEAALNTVQSSNEATNAKIKSFLNGGVHGLLTSADKDQNISPEQMTQVQEMIHQKISGSNNSKGITATPVMLNYQQIGMSPADLEIIKSIQFDEEMILKAFGIDPILFSKDSASYNNKKEASKTLVYNVIVPILNLLCDFYSELFEDPNVYIGYDISHFEETQQDLKTQVEALEKAWWVTPNEKRMKMDMELSKDILMDKIYIPSSFVPIDEVSVPLDVTLKNYDYDK